MTGVRGKDSIPGKYRKIPVGIGGGRFIPPPANEVPELMSDLERFIHRDDKRFDPLVDCMLVHYQFETIHPFGDGNGRVGRLLFAVMLQEAGGLTKPWLYMSEFFGKHRDEYCQRMFEVSSKGAWDSWVEFCIRGLLYQTMTTIERCEKLREIRERYLATVAGMRRGHARLHKVLEQILVQPFVEVARLPKLLNVSYPTAASDADRLVEVGILKDVPGVSPRTLYAPDIYLAAYSELDDDESELGH